MSDRYLRTGGEIPRIYPYTLKGLEQAIEDIERVSTFNPETVYRLSSIERQDRRVIRTYKGGLPWAASEVR